MSLVLGAHDGDAHAGSLGITGGAGETLLSGQAAFVEGTQTATHFLVLTDHPDRVALLAAGLPQVSVTATPGFVAPFLAEVSFAAAPAQVFQADASIVGDLARLARHCLAARAFGAASRGFDLIVDYAKERVQFGRKIGQFQAIQHKLANVLMQVETSRLMLWRAAAAYDRDDPDWRYAAGAAISVASPAIRQACLETHHAFGGVSFWEEHEMPRHFRRIHADLVRCGGVHAAREDMARYLEQAKIPDLDLGEKANAFREEIREWLAANWDGQFSEADMKRHLNERLASQGLAGQVDLRLQDYRDIADTPFDEIGRAHV